MTVSQSERHFGYMTELSGIELSDTATGGATSWIQAMPLGKYTHPFFGEIDFTPERLQRFADSVANNVRMTQLDIDYDHKMFTAEAAGWVQQAEFRPNEGLYLLVEWTKEAVQKIKDKVYKYFSPEFSDAWTNPKTGATYKDVLFGGGITNRPFLKDILPINLSELIKESGVSMTLSYGDKNYVFNPDGTTVVSGAISADSISAGTVGADPVPTPKPMVKLTQPAHQGGGNKMATKKFSELSLTEVQGLAKTLGLSDDAPVSQVEQALNDLVSKAAVAPPTPVIPTNEPPAQTQESIAKKLAEQGHLDEATLQSISALVADNPANKVLAEVIEAQQIELAQTSQALRFAEAQAKITKLAEKAIQKKFAFPAAVQDELRDILIDAPRQFSDKVYTLMEKLASTGMVQLGEMGRLRRDGVGQTAGLTLNERARQVQERNPGMSYADAVELVARDDPKTFGDYRHDVMELD